MKTTWILMGALALGSAGLVPQHVHAEDARHGAREFKNRDVRADVKREEVKFEDLPGDVKGAIGAEAKSDPVERVEKLIPDKGPIVYRATVGREKDSNQRVIVVNEHGKVLADADLDDYLKAGEEHHHHD